MTTSLNIKNFYEIYSKHSVEDIQTYIEKQESEKKEQEEKIEREGERCEMDCRYYTYTFMSDNGESIVSEFHHDLCQECDTRHNKYYNEDGTGGNGDPYLRLRILNLYIEYVLEPSILAKKENYDQLSDEELEKEIKENYSYYRYLRRTHHSWTSKSEPTGLLIAMEKNEEEEKALQFEKIRRIILNKIENSVAPTTP